MYNLPFEGYISNPEMLEISVFKIIMKNNKIINNVCIIVTVAKI